MIEKKSLSRLIIGVFILGFLLYFMILNTNNLNGYNMKFLPPMFMNHLNVVPVDNYNIPRSYFGKCNNTSKPKYLEFLQQDYTNKQINQMQDRSACFHGEEMVFHYKYNGEAVCQDHSEKIKIIISHYSIESEFQRRADTRKDYAEQLANLTKDVRDRFHVETMFFIGFQSNQTVERSAKLRQEYDEHKDIIQGYFKDFYRNLPHKFIFMANWLYLHCSHYQYVLKKDTDVKLYIGNLLKLHEKRPKHDYWLTGNLLIHTQPVRGKSHRVYISHQEYPRAFYPDYVDGQAVFYPMATLKLLFETSFKVPTIFIGDVWTYGLIREKTNITVVNLGGLFCRFKYKGPKCVSVHPVWDKAHKKWIYFSDR